jgi:hypothetical protein
MNTDLKIKRLTRLLGPNLTSLPRQIFDGDGISLRSLRLHDHRA